MENTALITYKAFTQNSHKSPSWTKKSSLASQNVVPIIRHRRKSYQKVAQPTWQFMLQEITETASGSLQQLAKKLDLSTATIQKILHGKIKNPHPLTFRKILHFYYAFVYLPKQGEVQC